MSYNTKQYKKKTIIKEPKNYTGTVLFSRLFDGIDK